MLPVGVQGEGGDQAPPLTVHDLAGVGVAQFIPVDGVISGEVDVAQGEIIENPDSNQDPEGGRAIVDQGCLLRGWGGPAMIFPLVLAQFFCCQRQHVCRDQQLPTKALSLRMAGDVACGQNQRPAAHLSF